MGPFSLSYYEPFPIPELQNHFLIIRNTKKKNIINVFIFILNKTEKNQIDLLKRRTVKKVIAWIYCRLDYGKKENFKRGNMNRFDGDDETGIF